MAETTHEGTEHPAEGGHGSGVFPPFDSSTYASQLIWLAIAFALLYWLMSKVALPRVAGIIETRRGKIAADLDAAQKAKGDSERAAEAYEASLAAARSKAHAIAAETHAAVGSETEATRASLEGDLAKKLAASEAQIAATKAAALGNVRGIAADAASTIVERLTGKAPASAAVEKAVDTAGGR